jgi:hypothetical protein
MYVVMAEGSKEYSRPEVNEHGSVSTVTAQNDKIGTVDDGIDVANLDGKIGADQ